MVFPPVAIQKITSDGQIRERNHDGEAQGMTEERTLQWRGAPSTAILRSFALPSGRIRRLPPPAKSRSI